MAEYLFEGSIRGNTCDDCWGGVAGADVLLYRHSDDQAGDDLVAAATKHTFQILDDKTVGDKKHLLIDSVTTDSEGNFSFDLGDRQDYDGAEFQIDVRIVKTGGHDHKPVQFTITSLKPEWVQEGNRYTADRWDHHIASRYWCYLLELFGLWLICGRVQGVGTNTGLSDMTVRAYDRDWLQDDLLGTDVTDANGNFHIYYTSSTFKKTPFSPFINVELTSGPDVYFEVDDSGGTNVIKELPADGRQGDRENVSRCFCVVLEVGDEPPPYDDPLFDHVGLFHIQWDIDPLTGLANKSIEKNVNNWIGGGGWAFWDFLKLKGFCPKVHQTTNQAMHYRFLYIDPVTLTEKPVTGDLLGSLQIGSKYVWWDANADGVFGYTTQSVEVRGSGATAPISGGTGPLPAHVIAPDTAGWIAIDQDMIDDGVNGALISLNTHKIVPGGSAPGSGAGVAPADPKVGAKVTLIFETATDPAVPATIERQAVTSTVMINNWHEVRQLNLLEFETGANGACTGLTSTVTIKYTVNHQFVNSWSLGMSSAASGGGWVAPALPSGNSSVAATNPAIDVSGPPPVAAPIWPPCSYTVGLTSRRSVSDGENNDPGNTTPVTFCKT